MNKFTMLYKAKKFEDHLEKRAAKLLKERAAARAKKKKEDREHRNATCLLGGGLKRFERQNYIMECDESNGTSLKTCFEDVLKKPQIQNSKPMEEEKTTSLFRRIEANTNQECDVTTENNIAGYKPLNQEDHDKFNLN